MDHLEMVGDIERNLRGFKSVPRDRRHALLGAGPI